jgi:hypothetical protein
MANPSNQLASFRHDSPARPLRSLWLRYQRAKWGWHIVVPIGIGGIAGVGLGWAWTMLDRNEYAVAMLLVLFFLLIGIGAALAIPRKILRALVILLVVIVTGFSGLKVVQEKGDQPWTRLWSSSKLYQMQMATAIVSDTSKPNSVAMFWVERGGQLKPINIMFMLRLISRQNAASMLESFSVEMRVDMNKWVKLQKLSKGRIYYLAKSFRDCKGFTEAHEMEFLSGFFEDAITKKNIQPGETVEGWVIFQIPTSSTSPSFSEGNFRLNLHETSGRAFSGIIPFAKPILAEDPAQPIVLRKVENVRDLTPLVVGKYDDVIFGTTIQDGLPCIEP